MGIVTFSCESSQENRECSHLLGSGEHGYMSARHLYSVEQPPEHKQEDPRHQPVEREVWGTSYRSNLWTSAGPKHIGWTEGRKGNNNMAIYMATHMATHSWALLILCSWIYCRAMRLVVTPVKQVLWL